MKTVEKRLSLLTGCTFMGILAAKERLQRRNLGDRDVHYRMIIPQKAARILMRDPDFVGMVRGAPIPLQSEPNTVTVMGMEIVFAGIRRSPKRKEHR